MDTSGIINYRQPARPDNCDTMGDAGEVMDAIAALGWVANGQRNAGIKETLAAQHLHWREAKNELWGRVFATGYAGLRLPAGDSLFGIR